MASEAVLKTDIPGVPVHRGKVRDIYDFGDRLLFVATDRISAFDWVLPNGIPGKGQVLNCLSHYWFDVLRVKHHMLPQNFRSLLPEYHQLESILDGRSMVVKKTQVIPFECVVRGYLSGSGWKEYQKSSTICGIELPLGLQESDRLEKPIFTPSTKAETGHDINISFEEMCKCIGDELANKLRDLSLDIYSRGAEYALSKEIIIADTKFEFGLLDGKVLLIDEVLTPDSSRFWPADQYEPSKGQPSYDKQFVRDWLENTGWDKNSPPPELPEEIIEKTREKYIAAYETLVGQRFPWK